MTRTLIASVLLVSSLFLGAPSAGADGSVNLLSRYVAMQSEYGAERESSKHDDTDGVRRDETSVQKAHRSDRQKDQRLNQ